MKKYYKTAAIVTAAIAALLILIGLIATLFQVAILSKAPAVFYDSATNFILFGILFYLAYANNKPKTD